MAFSGPSDSRKRSCATTAAERDSLTSPLRQMIRSCRSLEKISDVRQPPPCTISSWIVFEDGAYNCLGDVGDWSPRFGF